MTLQSSGAISLSDIQTEFGGSNPISLSEYYSGGVYVASGTGSIPSSGLISLNQFYGTSSVIPSWILTIDSGTNAWAYESGNSVVADSSGNLYVGAKADHPSYFGAIYKITPLGALSSSTGIASNTTNAGVGGIARDSLGNIYLLIDLYNINPSYTSNDSVLIKLNSSNSIVWARVLSTNFNNVNTWARDVKVSSDDNYAYALIANHYQSTNGYGTTTVKFDSVGNFQWGKINNPTNSSNYVAGNAGVSLSFSGSNVVVPSGIDYAYSSISGANLVAYGTSTGGYAWQKHVGNQAHQGDSGGTATDSSGNIYWASTACTGIGDTYAVLNKLDSAGTVQWQRCIYSGSNLLRAISVAIDSNGYIYMVSNNNNLGIHIAKYNSSGTLQWQRILLHTDSSSGTTYYIYPTRIIVDSSSTFVITGGRYNYSGAYNTLVAKFPLDGSKTGTYADPIIAGSNWVYGTSSMTENALSATGIFTGNGLGIYTGNAILSNRVYTPTTPSSGATSPTLRFKSLN